MTYLKPQAYFEMVSCHYHQRFYLYHETNFNFILQEPKTTTPNVNEADLSLSSTTKYEVTNQAPHLRQYVSYQGGKLQLRIPEFYLDGLKRKEYRGLISVLVPTESWLRTQLDVIEKFVQENVNYTKNLIGAQTKKIVYKPLWKGESMYCLLYTSPSPRDGLLSRMPSSA